MKLFLFFIFAIILQVHSQDHVVSLEEKYQFNKDGFLMIRNFMKTSLQKILGNLFDATEIQATKFYRSIIEKNEACRKYLKTRIEIATANELKQAIQDCSDINQGANKNLFYQILFLSEIFPHIRDLTMNKKLGKIAADLLGVDGVRYYQDGVFVKEAVNNTFRFLNKATGWHFDMNQIPLITNKMVVMWCPLTDLFEEQSTLYFANGTHLDIARFIHGPVAYTNTHISNKHFNFPFYKLGDCTFHHGYVYHMAPVNKSMKRRVSFTIMWIEKDAKALDIGDVNDEDKQSWERWAPTYKAGEMLREDDPYLPIVYWKERDEKEMSNKDEL
eukprot:TRINITY_DN4605_c0_g1_i2.p1 TRINITY_DN4605_c0_g1~~TRINITY_DN4605_c0_g1_i2.p1  ORF type:complete len:348 (+),score=63.88 TRINITY_DN4605_c0_g1_i2:57-1046(+)